MTYNCYYFLPFSVNQIEERFDFLKKLFWDIEINIYNALPKMKKYIFHIHLNGSLKNELDLGKFKFSNKLNLIITHCSANGKINAVNYGLERARFSFADLFFSIDNDIRLDPFSFYRILDCYNPKRFDGVGCHKLAILPVNATSFQYHISFFLNTITTNNLLYNFRFTGSLFAIDPFKIYCFPIGCNEADFFLSKKMIDSRVCVYTKYPSSLDEEIKRRAKNTIASIDYKFIKAIENVDFLNYFIEKRILNHNLPTHINRHLFVESYGVWCNMIEKLKMKVPNMLHSGQLLYFGLPQAQHKPK